jgi:aminopeptidase
MHDPRVEQYAALMVERCLNVQPNWQVVVIGSPLARPLIEQVVKYIAQRGAYALVRMNYANLSSIWLKNAPQELLSVTSPIDKYTFETMDAYLAIQAPENSHDGADVSPDRHSLFRQSRSALTKCVVEWTLPWVGCNFPTNALAQDAGMTLEQYADFLYGACLLDWDALARTMRHLADRFDAADKVQILGDETDLCFSLRGRKGMIDDGHVNMPGGEFFYSPIETSAQGVITFSEYPALYGGYAVEGVCLEFRDGVVVNASAKSNEEFLLKTLDSDKGARRLGELGIGCNPGIQEPSRSVLFDEKIYGTIHLALGNSFPFLAGTNVSNVHWDMVKNLRNNGKLLLDGVMVQENGKWLI